MVFKKKIYSIRSKLNKKSKKYTQYLRYKKSTIKKKVKKKYTKKRGGGEERVGIESKTQSLSKDDKTVKGEDYALKNTSEDKQKGEVEDIPGIDTGESEKLEEKDSQKKKDFEGIMQDNEKSVNDIKSKELAAAAAASSFSNTSQLSDIPTNFDEGLQYNNPELDQIKEQFKQQLNKLAVIIKNLANESEDWNSEENEKNIQILKENTIKQIDNIGIPVASAVAKTTGVLTGTAIKEGLMASGIMEVLTALKAAVITIKTVIDLVNDLGITQEAAPFVREKIKNLINKANSYSIPSEESITKQIEVVPSVPVTKQNFKILDANSGKQISDVELNQPKEGEQVFSVSKK